MRQVSKIQARHAIEACERITCQSRKLLVETIADALVYAVSYINCRPLEDHESRYDDGDVGQRDASGARPARRSCTASLGD
jgi:hypothetical protein